MVQVLSDVKSKVQCILHLPDLFAFNPVFPYQSVVGTLLALNVYLFANINWRKLILVCVCVCVCVYFFFLISRPSPTAKSLSVNAPWTIRVSVYILRELHVSHCTYSENCTSLGVYAWRTVCLNVYTPRTICFSVYNHRELFVSVYIHQKLLIKLRCHTATEKWQVLVC